MLKAIFFDLDGTLCHFHGDFNKIFIYCCSAIFQKYPDLTYESILSFWNKILSNEGALTASCALKELCIDLSVCLPDNHHEIARLLCHTYVKHISPVNGIHTLLESLSKNYKLALITNGPLDMQNATIDALNIRNFFDVILISGDPHVRYRKPNPLIFQLALEMTQTRSEEALMVGDNLKADIFGSQNLGLHTLFIGETSEVDVRSVDCILSLTSILERDFGVHNLEPCKQSHPF